MARTEKSIEVNAPIRAVYNQWTQFEDFPEFMEGVEEVEQLDDTHLRWCARIAGKELEWTAEIVDQLPDQCISWRATSGKQNAGTVRFEKLDENRTRVFLAMDYEPEGLIENVGSAVGVPGHRMESDLKRFKEFIERRGVETGGWRGEVHNTRKVNEPETM